MLKLKSLPYYLFLSAIPLFIQSCSQFDPPVVVPAYGHIDSIHFYVQADSASTLGTASANIPYAWVYLDDNPVGAFQMPCTFPIVASNGVHNILIYPGIDPANGNTALSIDPFYQYYSVNVTLTQGQVTDFHPTSTYYNWVNVLYKEDFDETSTTPLYLSEYTGSLSPSDTSIKIITKSSCVFDGKGGSGLAIVTPGNHHYFIGVTTTLTLPTNGQAVYMELNYRATTYFSIGVFDGYEANFISPSAIVLPTPTGTWKKMYVSLNNTIQTFSLEAYNIYFAMASDTVDNHSVDSLLLDNIKVLD